MDIARTASSTLAPWAASSEPCFWYDAPSEKAAAKIDGLVVTPTMCLLGISSARLPLCRR